jgi:undecaprenyl-diphosphatase
VLWVSSIVLVLAVGFSRVFLGVHYPSDILAGWALAIAWGTTVLVTSGLLIPGGHLPSSARR